MPNPSDPLSALRTLMESAGADRPDLKREAALDAAADADQKYLSDQIVRLRPAWKELYTLLDHHANLGLSVDDILTLLSYVLGTSLAHQLPPNLLLHGILKYTQTVTQIALSPATTPTPKD